MKGSGLFDEEGDGVFMGKVDRVSTRGFGLLFSPGPDANCRAAPIASAAPLGPMLPFWDGSHGGEAGLFGGEALCLGKGESAGR